MIFYYFPFIILSLHWLIKSEKYKKTVPWFVFLYFFILVILRGDTSSDYSAYLLRYNEVEYDNGNIFDNYDSFIILRNLLKYVSLNNYRLIIIIYGIVTFYSLYAIVFIDNKYKLITLFYFYSYFFFVQPVGAIRAGASALLFLLAILSYLRKHKIKTIFLFIFSIFMHPTSIIGIFVFNKYFFKKYKISHIFYISILSFLAGKFIFSQVISFLEANNLGFLTSKSEAYRVSIENDVGNRTANFFIIVITLKLILNIIIRHFYYITNNKNQKIIYLLNIQVFAFVLYYFTFSLPVVAARFYELIGIVEIIIITFPILIFKEKKEISLLISGLIFIQFIITVHLLGGEIVKPFYFYFL